MIADLKPYPTMKDSGVPWLGELPEHWAVNKLRNLLNPVAERNRSDLPLLSVVREKGVIQRDTTNKDENRNFIPDDLTNYKTVRSGQFAMNKMKAWQGSYGVSQHEGIVSPAYYVFDLAGVPGEFFNSAIRSRAYVPFFAQASDGVRIGQWDLAQARMKEIPFLIPPLTEQSAIVRFLDHAGRDIRRYILAKQKLIKLLEEQKQVIIHRAVTRGLDPNVRLKPSGIEWLGDVPGHWEVLRLKTLCRMRSGDGITAMAIEPAGDYPVYGGNGVRGYTSNFTHDGVFVLIGRQGALCGNVHIARGRFWASEHAVVASLSSGHILEWFAAILMVMNLNQYSIAAAQPGLAVERVLNLWLPVPPADDQQRIVTHIEHETSDINQVVGRAQREIDLLREYRIRLIADVVTGKLDVRAAAAKLPEETEPEPLDGAEALAEGDDETEGVDLDAVPEEAEA